MFPNMYNPYWWMRSPLGMPFQQQRRRNVNLQRIDVGGIYVLTTNAVQLTEGESVDYGINPCLYNCLPCESIVLLKIHADVPDGGEALPVTIVVPNNGRTTLDTTGTGTATGSTNIPVMDSQGTQIVGDDVEGQTERLAYINKRTGVIRFLEFTSGAAAAEG